MEKMYSTLNKIPEKKIKETGKMFKELGKVAGKLKAIPYVGAALESVLPFLEAIAPLFQAFEPILVIFNAVFTAFAGALTAKLIPVLMPLFEKLIDMIPIFMELGGIVGEFIGALLVPFVDVLIEIIPAFAEFLTNLMESEDFLMLVSTATDLFVSGIMFLIGNLDILIPFVNSLIIAFMVLINNLDVLVPFVNDLIIVFSLISSLIGNIFLPMVDAFKNAIFDVIEVLTFGLVSLGGGIMPSFQVPLYPEEYTPSEPYFIPGLQEFQYGTDLITKSGLFYGDVGEAVTPATEVGLQTSLLEEIRDLQREQLLEVKWRMR